MALYSNGGTKKAKMIVYMDGFELYTELKKIDPSIKVCFLTASEMYYEDAREKNHPDFREDVFIQKPISTDDLIMKINEKIHSNNKQ